MSLRSNQDAKNIGARFRSARSLVPDLNRKSFCERYGINRYTMQSWENGLHVSKGKNVEKFIEALAREGVSCSSEWLIDGRGEPAKPINRANTRGYGKQETQTSSVANNVKAPESFFSKEGMVSLTLEDTAMAPKFLAGDEVYGLRLGPDHMAAHQKYCIIRLNPERMIARKVLVTKEGFLVVALDERVPTFILNFESEIYIIKWHLLKQ